MRNSDNTTLINDPSPNKVVSKLANVDPKVQKQAEAIH